MNFYPRLRVNVFVIQHDGSLGEPQIQKKTFNDKEVWVVSVNMYVDKPRILPMPLVDRIRLLEPMMNEDVAMSGLNDSSMSESGDSNSSELTENCPRKIEGDVARIVIAVEQITTSCHNSKADWPRHLAGANLTAEEMQELEARHMAD
ncbi:uncharacterized protein FFC1_13612 [Fusarium fujikuroi]|nr:uncharacterized protein FFC1_13612 [Fusarium fujikuroi]